LKSDHPVTLINLKALKERLHYENLKKRLESHESQALQALLFPIKIEFSTDQSLVIEKNIQLFEKLGVSLRSFGSKVWLVEALSSDIDEGRVKDWIESILEHLQTAKVEENAAEKLLLKLLKKQQFKAERPEGLELSRMLKELFSYKDNFFSPHGEKILSPLSLEQFERLL
jgi:DNA mismatch repair ATPase MutL